MTKMGDAKSTEQGVINLSGHRAPDAARGYVKRTESQRLAAARKRLAWITNLERRKKESQNKHQNARQNSAHENVCSHVKCMI